jgi:hypothetical protein
MINNDWTHTWVNKDGLKLKATIPPYVWMYHGGKVDIDIKDEQGCDARFVTPFMMDKDSVENLAEFAELCPIKPHVCKVCNAKILFRESAYRKADECEVCAMKRFDKEFAVIHEDMDKKEKKRDLQHMEKGYRWKLIAWVHPSRGDDYQIVTYGVNRITPQDALAILKKKGSRVLNDYTIIDLFNN